jgi:hypothetical protein
MKKCIAHTVLTTKLPLHPKRLWRYGQHTLHTLQNYLCIRIVYDDMYSTNCNRYNILFMSPEYLWRNVLHIPYSPQNYLCIQNVYDDMHNTYYTHDKITCASATSMTICTAQTVIATIFYSWVSASAKPGPRLWHLFRSFERPESSQRPEDVHLQEDVDDLFRVGYIVFPRCRLVFQRSQEAFKDALIFHRLVMF